MPRIPEASNIQIRVPRGATRAPGMVAPRLYQDEALGVASDALKEVAQKKDNEELANAEVQFNLAQIAAQEKYQNDEDIDTIDDRFAADMNEGLGNAASYITDSNIRNMFVERTQVQVEADKLKMGQVVQQRKNDREIGYMENAFEAMTKGAIATGNIPQATKALQLSLDSMVERNVISREQAEATLRSRREEMTLGALRAMSPQEMIDALDQPWVNNLGADQLRALKTEAMQRVIETESYDAAVELIANPNINNQFEASMALNAMYADDPNRAQRMKESITWYNSLETQRGNAETQKELDLYQKVDLQVRDGAITLEMLRDPSTQAYRDFKEMLPAHRSNVENYLRQVGAGTEPKVSDFSVWHNLNVLERSGRRKEALDYFMANWSRLTASDRKHWDDILVGGQADGMFSQQQRVLAMTEKMGWSKANSIITHINDWYMQYQRDPANAGQPPSDQMVEEFIDRTISEAETGTLWNWGGKSVALMDDEEKLEFYEKMREKDRANSLMPEARRTYPKSGGTWTESFLGRMGVEDAMKVRGDYLRSKDSAAYDEAIQYFYELQERPTAESFEKKWREFADG